MNILIVDGLRGVATRKEDARKKHSTFFQKIKSERDKTYSNKDKSKQAYDDACLEILNMKAKLSKSTGDQDKVSNRINSVYLINFLYFTASKTFGYSYIRL
jgi:hypothetical protein